MINTRMKYRLLPILFFPLTFLFSCNSNEIGKSNDVNPETIYFDYKIWGEEGDEDITVMLQYRFGGPRGTTLTLENPYKVELDGTEIKVDSSKYTGAYYEVIKPVNEFTGKHTIVFTDANGKKYTEDFSFQPVILKTELPAEIQRDDIVLEMDGLDPLDHVRILMTDTSYTSEGINRLDTVKNGRVLISKYDLNNLVNGPVHLELFKETEKPLKERTEEGGKLSITYGVKREFMLINKTN